jgi:phospholipid/cholesterol/gamma-HCH transport system substrate-binding protein
MAGTSTEIVTGGVVLAAALGFLVYAGQVAGLAGGSAPAYEMTASFRSADGITVGTDVRLAGVKVGTVTAISLNPGTFRADTRFTVADGIALPEDTAALISSEGLLGGNFLELRPGGSPFNLEPGAEIVDTQGSVSLVTLLLRFVTGEGEGAAP